MNNFSVAYFAAIIFGLGLGISGMTLPTKIIGFLDVTGNWDPSLLFVMVGAIGVHAVSYRFITRRPSPLLAPKFQIPSNRKLDRKLVIGSLIFGLGWGLGGFCPGPSIVAMVSGAPAVLMFVVFMFVGIFLHHFVFESRSSKEAKLHEHKSAV